MPVSVATSAFAGRRSATLTIDAGAAGKASVAIAIEFTEPPPPPPPPQYGGSAWPKWHHDNRSSGLSHVDTSANTGALKWKTFVSAPVACVTDGRTDQKTRCGTYVSSPVLTEEGNVVQLGGNGTLYVFDRASGRKIWSVLTAPPWISANEGTPTVVKDGSVFLMTAGESHDKSQFYKITKGGQTLYSKRSPSGDGWDSSPALDDDGTLYLSNDDRGTIQAFAQDGNEAGEVTLSPQSDVETQSAALADGIGYWSANGHLWALTPSRQHWSFTDPVAATKQDWPAHFLHNIKSSPALTPDGKVIYTYVFETTKNGKTTQTTRIYAFQAGTTLKHLWTATLGPSLPKPGLSPGGGLPADYADSLHYRSGITSPAVGPDGTIWVGHCDGLFALDPATGAHKWGIGMSEVVGSPAVGKDGTIYSGSMDGMLHAIAPDGPGKWTEKWAVKTKGQLNSSPAIGADGTVYAMSDDGYLYAIH
jgi:outer membrane protein assembly factor BamB